jgi:hypothetical protein
MNAVMPDISPAQTPALSRWQRGWAFVRECRAVVLRQYAQVMSVTALVCWVMWLLRPAVALDVQAVYSMSMGFLCMSFIGVGRFFIDQDSPYYFPRGWKAPALILIGVLASFLIGTALGDWYQGLSTFDLLRRAPDLFAFILMFSLGSGFAISYFFYAQGKSAYLQTEIEASQRRATEAQLKLLQSQLDPHMLFNTLANLRALIETDPPRATAMLDQLNRFLRSTLAASRETEHSLQAEFDRIRDYLALMQVRMGARLQVTLDLPPAIAHVKVPTLILQSLVENAIVHGLEPSVDGGQLRVSARGLYDGPPSLELEVSDTGVGLGCDPSELREGFGLTQVRERLMALHGNANLISIEAANAHQHPHPHQHPHSHPGGAKDHKPSGMPDASSSNTGCRVTLLLPVSGFGLSA